jgi:magnesium transporter
MKVMTFNAEGCQLAPVDNIATLLAANNGPVWVDITGPMPEDVRVMRDIFHFHPLAIEDTHNQQQRPKIEEYAGYMFIILNPVSILANEVQTDEKSKRPAQDMVISQDDLWFRELDIFVGRNYIVTVHPEEEPAIAEAYKRINTHVGVVPAITPGYLLYSLMDVVVDGYFPILDMLEEEISALEDMILASPRQAALNRLFQLKRMLAGLWRVIWPQRDMFNTLVHHNPIFADQTALQYYMRDVADHLLRIADMVNTFRDILTSIIDLYMSAVSNRLNRVVNRLTVFTLIIGVMTVIGGFYGMNFETTWPPFSADWGVLFVIALMIVCTAVLLVVLKRLKWY